MGQVRPWLPTLALLGKNGQVGAEGLQSAAKAMITWQNAFKLSDDSVVQTLEKAVALSKTQFISTSELIESSTLLNKIWADSGGNIDQMLSTIAAVKTAIGVSASVVSRGIGTIIQRVTAPTTKNFLRSEGVEMFGDDGQFKGILPILQDIKALSDGLGSATEQGKELKRILAGVRQQSIGSTLLDSLDQIAKSLETTGSALFVLERGAEMGLQSWTTKTEQLKATYQDPFNTLGQSPLGAFGKDILVFQTILPPWRLRF